MQKIAVVFITLFFCSLQLFANSIGVFLIVKNKVFIERASEVIKVQVGQKVNEGDLVYTEVDSRAKIVMNDRNVINVAPSTKLKIAKYSTGATRDVNINLIEGKIRNSVIEKYDGDKNKFEVRTSTAVAGVRGTRFITSYDAATRVTEVVTLKGVVNVVRLSEKNVPLTVTLQKNESVKVNEDSQQLEPIKLPESEIKNIESDTEVKKGDKKKEDAEAGADNGKGAVNNPELDEDEKRRRLKNKDMIGDNVRPPTGVIDNAIDNRFDKTKVKVIIDQ